MSQETFKNYKATKVSVDVQLLNKNILKSGLPKEFLYLVPTTYGLPVYLVNQFIVVLITCSLKLVKY